MRSVMLRLFILFAVSSSSFASFALEFECSFRGRDEGAPLAEDFTIAPANFDAVVKHIGPFEVRVFATEDSSLALGLQMNSPNPFPRSFTKISPYLQESDRLISRLEIGSNCFAVLSCGVKSM